ncbi:hypothetical protein N7523_008517 [Penicillium sp. IBT 18751x]|nr:hypothetical protein N7523_008517 [Penicillium sp. IBT 18751x]
MWRKTGMESGSVLHMKSADPVHDVSRLAHTRASRLSKRLPRLPRGLFQQQQTTNIDTNMVYVDGETKVFPEPVIVQHHIRWTRSKRRNQAGV